MGNRKEQKATARRGILVNRHEPSLLEQRSPAYNLLTQIHDHLSSLRQPLSAFSSPHERLVNRDGQTRGLVEKGALILREWIEENPEKTLLVPSPVKTEWNDFVIRKDESSDKRKYTVMAELPRRKKVIPNEDTLLMGMGMEDKDTDERMWLSVRTNGIFDLQIVYEQKAKRSEPRPGIVGIKPSVVYDPYEQFNLPLSMMRNVDAQLILYFMGDFIQKYVESLPKDQQILDIPHDLFDQHNVRDNIAYQQAVSTGKEAVIYEKAS